MSPVQHRIYELAPHLNPAGVEAHIRDTRKILAAGSTIDHLSQEELLSAAQEAETAESEQTGHLHNLTIHLGLESDHSIWDSILIKTGKIGPSRT